MGPSVFCSRLVAIRQNRRHCEKAIPSLVEIYLSCKLTLAVCALCVCVCVCVWVCVIPIMTRKAKWDKAVLLSIYLIIDVVRGIKIPAQARCLLQCHGAGAVITSATGIDFSKISSRDPLDWLFVGKRYVCK